MLLTTLTAASCHTGQTFDSGRSYCGIDTKRVKDEWGAEISNLGLNVPKCDIQGNCPIQIFSRRNRKYSTENKTDNIRFWTTNSWISSSVDLRGLCHKVSTITLILQKGEGKAYRSNLLKFEDRASKNPGLLIPNLRTSVLEPATSQ